jgi:hypothetical protein
VTRVSVGLISLKRRGAPGAFFAGPGSVTGSVLQRVRRRGSLGLQQRIVDRRDLAQAVNLKARHFEQRHLGKGAHLGA